MILPYVILCSIVSFTGFMILAYYFNCNPLETGQVQNIDQLTVLFAKEILGLIFFFQVVGNFFPYILLNSLLFKAFFMVYFSFFFQNFDFLSEFYYFEYRIFLFFIFFDFFK